MASKKAQKAPLQRCGGTMTESQWLAWVRSALRSRWLRWPPRAAALRAAQRPYSGENKRQKHCYECALCCNMFSQKEVAVDHFPREAGSILSVGDIGEFCNNLFCEVDNLRVLCHECHAVHTLACRNGITHEEARLQKKVTEFLKDKKKVLDFLSERGYSGASVSNEEKRRTLVEKIFKEEACL